MNFKEIKVFSSTNESIEYHRLNPDCGFVGHLYQIQNNMLDMDRIIAFRPHNTESLATVLEVQGSNNDFIVPMEYEKFKSFFHKNTISN